jgi:hypothetical protein
MARTLKLLSLFLSLLMVQESIGFSLPTAFKPSLLQSSHLCVGPGGSTYEYALLFDCDGVILETEELHRRAYNAAFTEFGLTIDGEPVEWSVRTFLMIGGLITIC